jgi:hypothetical protein
MSGRHSRFSEWKRGGRISVTFAAARAGHLSPHSADDLCLSSRHRPPPLCLSDSLPRRPSHRCWGETHEGAPEAGQRCFTSCKRTTFHESGPHQTACTRGGRNIIRSRRKQILYVAAIGRKQIGARLTSVQECMQGPGKADGVESAFSRSKQSAHFRGAL